MQREGVRADDVTYSVLLQNLWHTPEAAALMEEAWRRSSAFALPDGLARHGDAARGVGARLPPALAGRSGGDALGALAAREAPRQRQAAARAHQPHHWLGQERQERLPVSRPTAWRGARAGARLLGACGVPSRSGPAAVERRSASSPRHLRSRCSSSRPLGSGGRVRAAPLCRGCRDAGNRGVVEIDTTELGGWIRRAIASGLVRGWFGVEERLIIRLGDEQIAAIERACQVKAPEVVTS